MFNRATALGFVLVCCLAGAPAGLSTSEFELQSAIVFTTTRDAPTIDPNAAAEIYIMRGDGTDPQRLTENTAGEAFATLSPDGKKIVFNSGRNRAAGGDPANSGELFLMDTDGGYQTAFANGSSATWSPDGKNISYHASASGTGLPIKPDPGAATTDSDIFVLNVDDALAGLAERRNLTNSPDWIDDDADWSPDGQTILFTRHPVTDDPINSIHAEIYAMNADGTGEPVRLTDNLEEERAVSWSPDGTRVVFMCRRGGPDFELCVMNADGTSQVQLTDNAVLDATATWSPDGQQIIFHRPVLGRFQLFVINPDGTGQVQLTNTSGINGFANWGEVRVHVTP
jgi:TolB protein